MKMQVARKVVMPVAFTMLMAHGAFAKTAERPLANREFAKQEVMADGKAAKTTDGWEWLRAGFPLVLCGIGFGFAVTIAVLERRSKVNTFKAGIARPGEKLRPGQEISFGARSISDQSMYELMHSRHAVKLGMKMHQN
jgi:hypothetical protein